MRANTLLGFKSYSSSWSLLSNFCEPQEICNFHAFLLYIGHVTSSAKSSWRKWVKISSSSWFLAPLNEMIRLQQRFFLTSEKINKSKKGILNVLCKCCLNCFLTACLKTSFFFSFIIFIAFICAQKSQHFRSVMQYHFYGRTSAETRARSLSRDTALYTICDLGSLFLKLGIMYLTNSEIFSVLPSPLPSNHRDIISRTAAFNLIPLFPEP